MTTTSSNPSGNGAGRDGQTADPGGGVVVRTDKAARELFRQIRDISTCQRLILHCALDGLDRTGGNRFQRSTSQLASDAGIHPETVRQALRDLRLAGWITREDDAKGGKPSNVARYRFAPQMLALATEPVATPAGLQPPARAQGVEITTPLAPPAPERGVGPAPAGGDPPRPDRGTPRASAGLSIPMNQSTTKPASTSSDCASGGWVTESGGGGVAALGQASGKQPDQHSAIVQRLRGQHVIKAEQLAATEGVTLPIVEEAIREVSASDCPEQHRAGRIVNTVERMASDACARSAAVSKVEARAAESRRCLHVLQAAERDGVDLDALRQAVLAKCSANDQITLRRVCWQESKSDVSNPGSWDVLELRGRMVTELASTRPPAPPTAPNVAHARTVSHSNA